MKITGSFWTVTLLILAALCGTPFATSPAHGILTGLLCIASSDSNSCPQSSPGLSAPMGTVFSVAVNIQSSDSLNAFDITVTTNSSVLMPLSIDLNDSIIPASVLWVLQDSTSSFGSIGAAQLVVTGLGFQSSAPTTGTLFRINYQVVGVASSVTLFSFESAQVLGDQGGRAVLLPENLQAASFTVHPPEPDFTIEAFPLTLHFPVGSVETSNIDVSSANGFSGPIALSTATSDTRMTAALSNSSVFLSDRSSFGISLVVSSTLSLPPGDYLVTVEASNSSVSRSVSIVVFVSDFALPYPVDLNMLIGGSGDCTACRTVPNFSTSLQIFADSIVGFSGDITLSTNISPSLKHGPSLSLSNSQFFLNQTSPSGSVHQYATTLTITATNNTPIGTYLVNVVAVSGLLSHSLVITVVISR